MSASLLLRAPGHHATDPGGPPQEEFNTAWLQAQQQRVIQALGGDEESYNCIVEEPSPLAALYASRSAYKRNDPEQYTQVVLLFLLEDIMRRRPLRFADLRNVWFRLLVPSSPLHLVIDTSLWSFGSVTSLFTLGTQLRAGLRLNAQPVQVSKRRKISGPTPPEQAVRTVILIYLAALDGAEDATMAEKIASYQTRWGTLTAGWTYKLDESIQLAGWIMALTSLPVSDVNLIQELMQLRPE